MAEATVVPAKRRAERGSRSVQRLRAQGEVPAILYGHQEEVIPLVVSVTSLQGLLRHGAHGLIDLEVDGRKESAVIKEMQWDVFGREVLHVDFHRVSRDEQITVDVPIVLKGTAPGVTAGGILEQSMHSIEIRCSAANIQESVVVSLNHLALGESILVKDLELNPGATALADAEQLVVHVLVPQAQEAEEEAAAASAEPELIRREKEEESEGQ